MKAYFLEGYLEGGQTLRRVRVDAFPFSMGRGDGASLTLFSDGISRRHAQLEMENGQTVLRDLNSTNGCFVNRNAVTGSMPIEHGDILHIAEVELRFLEREFSPAPAQASTRHGIAELSEQLPVGTRQLREMLLQKQVKAVFQPIVHADDETLFAYEILGRGNHPELPEMPNDLFPIAESLNLAVRMSELMRLHGVEMAVEADPEAKYFFNIHPLESLQSDRLIETLLQLREGAPELDLVLEIHQRAATDLAALQHLREVLRSLDMELAFDDFGAGQARLLELAEATPEYIKLDISMVRDLDTAPPARQKVVETVIDLSHANQIRVIAEGVETRGEADACRRMGCDGLQGFIYGRPAPTLAPVRDDG